MKKDAAIDATQQYRYRLLREWDSNAPRVVFVMLNPSTADAEIDDNTIKRCIHFARSWEYGSIEVVNLFGYRAKDFDSIKSVPNPMGDENNKFITTAVNRASIVVAAWGDNGTYLSRDLEVIALISEVKDVYCLGKTSKGNPRHPLYLDSSTMLEMYKSSDGGSVPKNKEELQSSSNVKGEEEASSLQILSTELVSEDSESKNRTGEDIVKDEQNKIKVTDRRCTVQGRSSTQDELTKRMSLGVSKQIIKEKNNKTSKTTYIILALFIIGAIYAYTFFNSKNTSSTSSNTNSQSHNNLGEYFPTDTSMHLTFYFYGSPEYLFLVMNQTVEKQTDGKYLITEQVSSPPNTPSDQKLTPYKNGRLYELSPNSIKLVERFGGVLNNHSTDAIIVLSDEPQWQIEKGVMDKITGLHKQISTPAGTFDNCIEVTEENSVLKSPITLVSYFAPKIGLILQKTKVGNMDFFVSQQLMQYSTSSTRSNTPSQSQNSSSSTSTDNNTFMFRGNPQHTGVSGSAALKTLGDFILHVKTNGPVRPAIANNEVFYGDGNGIIATFHAIDALNGNEKWNVKVNSDVCGAPAVSNDMVYFGDFKGTFHALQIADGNEKWSLVTDSGVFESPTISNGIVYFTNGKILYALDSITGEQKWNFQNSGSILLTTSPAIADGVVYIGSESGYLYAIDALTGKEKWNFKSGGCINSSAAIMENIVYFGSDDTYLYALESKSGKEKWMAKTAYTIGSSPAVFSGSVYILSEDYYKTKDGSNSGFLYAIDTNSGQIKWKFETKRRTEPGTVDSTSPSIADSILYFGGLDGTLYAIDCQTSEKIWQYDYGTPFASSPAIIDGVVYFSTIEGAIFSLGSDLHRGM